MIVRLMVHVHFSELAWTYLPTEIEGKMQSGD